MTEPMRTGGRSDCIEWTGSKTSAGYGNRRIGGKNYLVHRLAFAEAHGREPDGILRHTCDNRLCYNVDHLIEGTFAENSQDMIDRDRHNRGERHPMSKLSANEVIELRRRFDAKENRKDLAAAFGISVRNVYVVGSRKGWADERNFDGLTRR